MGENAVQSYNKKYRVEKFELNMKEALSSIINERK